jgi:hypothetical protein
MRSGPEMTLNVPQGLACCHSGPSGCTCYVAMFFATDIITDEDVKVGAEGSMCLQGEADTGMVITTPCTINSTNVMVSTTNYTSEFAQIEAFTTYPREDRCFGPRSQNCEEGSLLGLVSCTQGNDAAINSTRLSYDVGSSMIKMDACPGLCVGANATSNEVSIMKCGTFGTKFARRCGYAPNNTPMLCPDENYV